MYQQKSLAAKETATVKKTGLIAPNIEEVVITKYVEPTPKKVEKIKKNAVKEELETQLEIAQRKLQEANRLLRKQEEEQAKLQYENNSLHQERTKLVEQTKLLREKQLEQKDNIASPTTAIMKNLDQMLTLEDYKILLTILKEQQKKNKIKEALNQQRIEQLKFSSIEEAYKNPKY